MYSLITILFCSRVWNFLRASTIQHFTLISAVPALTRGQSAVWCAEMMSPMGHWMYIFSQRPVEQMESVRDSCKTSHHFIIDVAQHNSTGETVKKMNTWPIYNRSLCRADRWPTPGWKLCVSIIWTRGLKVMVRTKNRQRLNVNKRDRFLWIGSSEGRSVEAICRPSLVVTCGRHCFVDAMPNEDHFSCWL